MVRYRTELDSIQASERFTARFFNLWSPGLARVASKNFTIPDDLVVYTAEKDLILETGEDFVLRLRSPQQNMRYEWRKDGVALDGGSSSTYTIQQACSSDKGVYSVVLTGETGVTKEVTVANVIDVKQGLSSGYLVEASKFVMVMGLMVLMMLL